MTALDQAVSEFRAQGATVIASFGNTSEVATQRLIQLEGTLAGIDVTLAEAREALKSVAATSSSVQTLVDGEGTALVSDAEFERHVREMLDVMVADGRMVLGVADQVPPDGLRSRVAQVVELVERYGRYA